MRIKLVTDSCCDLPLSFVEAHSDMLEVIGMPVLINEKEYIDDLGKSFSHNDFYDLLRKGVMPNTSQINAYRFKEVFEEAVKAGYAVINLGLTSGMSGTYNSANIAKQMVLEEYPHGVIEVVDTLSASVGLGAMIVEAMKRIEAGQDALSIAQWLSENRLRFNHWFGVDDLNYLKNGGRISPATAVVGNMLNVKPTLIVDQEGKLKSYGNVRGRKKSLTFLASKVDEHLINPDHATIVLGHGNCAKDAEQLVDIIRSKHANIEIIVTELSMTIASHVGPNMIAVAFYGEMRED